MASCNITFFSVQTGLAIDDVKLIRERAATGSLQLKVKCLY